MRIITIDMNSLKNSVYGSALIRQGEHLASELLISLSSEFKEYNCHLIFQLNNRTPVVTPTLIPDDHDVLHFALTNALTNEAGRLKLEIVATDESGVIMKSAGYVMEIKASIDGTNTEVMPAEYAPWYIKALEEVNAAKAMVVEFNADETQRQVNELARKADEETRKENELARKADEETRKENEVLRGQTAAEARAYLDEFAANEVTRQQTFTTNEAGRQSTFSANEATRGTNETARKAAEVARATTFGQWADTQAGWAAAEAARVNDFSSKVDKVTTVNGKALSANVSVTAADVPNTPAGGVAATTVQGAINELDTEKASKADTYTKLEVYTKTEVDTKDATKADKLMATNLITNGDFVSDLSDWSYTGTKATWVDGRAHFNRPVGMGLVSLRQNVLIPNGNKIYFRVDVDMIKNVPTSYGIFNNSGSPSVLFLLNDVPVGKKTLTRVLDITLWKTLYINTPEGVEYYLDNMIMIDLTATFGAGNEPTVEQMDRLLAEFPNSWFDGTQEILPIKTVNELLNEKANKTWSIPQKLTLFSGWTGDLYYQTNDMGEVYLYTTNLVVGTGSSDVDIASFPVGLRPISYSVFNGYNSISGANPMFMINPIGTLKLKTSSTTGQGISFSNIFKIA